MIVVWFSCGAASAVAAKKTIEKYGAENVRVVNNPVIEEDEDNRRFLKDVEKWLGVPIEFAINEKYPDCSAVGVWEKRKFMSGPDGAPCTLELKKMARRNWQEKHNPEFHVLGFTADERKRYDWFVKGEGIKVLPVLIDAEITKADCFRILEDAKIEIPRIYKMGYPNANCIGCVKASSPTYWNHVRKVHPDIFNDRMEQSKRIGAKLVICHPKYFDWCKKRECGEWYDERTGKCLHATDKRTGKRRLMPYRVSLHELPAHVVGQPMKNLYVECGIFCALEDVDFAMNSEKEN